MSNLPTAVASEKTQIQTGTLQTGQGQNLHSFIEVALRDSSIDVAKLDALLRMQREVRADWAQEQFAVAMASCQGEIQQVVKDSENKQTSSWFAKLEKVDVAVRPVYTRHGFSVGYSEEVGGDGSMIVLICAVSHTGGHTKEYRMAAPPDTLGPKGSPTKTQLHGRSSTNTTLRRYLLCMAFNIVLRGMDDDGNKGGFVPLNGQQVAEIKALISQTSTDTDAMLLHYFGDDVRVVEDVPMTWYAQLKNALLRKLHDQQRQPAP